MTERSHDLTQWVMWEQRPFPDANLLLLQGQHPALVESGFVGHAQDTADWALSKAPELGMVVNTHWHSDHVGGNGLLQTSGVAVAASLPDAEAISRRDPGCRVSVDLDQPVAPYTADVALTDGQQVSGCCRSGGVMESPHGCLGSGNLLRRHGLRHPV